MNTAPTVNREAIERLAKSSDGLTGAWLREVVQSALITSISGERDLITKEDLTASLKDILKRRGMAYRVHALRSHRSGIGQCLRPMNA
jgi:ATP-dependent 26S proteasome regulatory subunit